MIEINDKEVVWGIFSDVCTFCRHKKDGYKCDAFDDIPEEIWKGINDHNRPYPGDNGIQFEAL